MENQQVFEPGVRYVAPRHIVIDGNPTPVPFWEVNRELFKDETIVVMGGGPSHVEVDIELLSHLPIIAVNSACRKVEKIVKETDVLYFSDNSWSERYLELIKSWRGLVVTSNRNTKARLGDLVNRLNLDDLINFMQIQSDHVCASSGHSAVCLGAYLGAKRIILIGFECQAINGRTHGHNDYQMDDMGPFKERFLPGWRELSFGFEKLGVEIINSTPNSMIKEFIYFSLNEALAYYA